MIRIKKEENSLKIKILFLKITYKFNFQKKVIKALKYFLLMFDSILPKNDKKIAFVLLQTQENKTDALYDYVKTNHPEYKCLRFANNISKINNKKDLISFYTFRGLYEIYTSKYVIIASPMEMLDYIKPSRHTGINLWHGMPIKTIGMNSVMPAVKKKRYQFVGKYYKTFASSDIFKLIMATSFMAEFKDVYVTGLPITDKIFRNENNLKVETVFNTNKYSKIVAYFPTFKSSAFYHSQQVNHEFNNIFYFDDYDSEDFVNFIESQNILFIIKPHPIDEKLYKSNPDKIPNSSNFKLVFNDDFISNGIDLYDLYKYIDLMISDFSSTALDYMILNKPILYLDNLAEEYSQNRGFNLPDNYHIFMPGHTIKTYSSLKEKMGRSLYNDDTVELRNRLIPFVHKYCDNKASDRIFKIMTGNDNAEG